MDVQAEKLELIKLLLNTDSPSIIDKVKSIFKEEVNNDFWNELSLDQQQRLEESIEQAKNGEVIAFDSFIEKYL